MHRPFPVLLARAGCLLSVPLAIASCGSGRTPVIPDRALTTTATSTPEIDSGSELHPGAASGALSEDEVRQPLAVAARFLQQLLNPTADDDPRGYATARLAAELTNPAADTSSTRNQGEAARVTSVRMLRKLDDWATAVAIVERTTADGPDVYLLTLTRQPDDRWLVADVTLR